jgi:hypothetical protein
MIAWDQNHYPKVFSSHLRGTCFTGVAESALQKASKLSTATKERGAKDIEVGWLFLQQVTAQLAAGHIFKMWDRFWREGHQAYPKKKNLGQGEQLPGLGDRQSDADLYPQP